MLEDAVETYPGDGTRRDRILYRYDVIDTNNDGEPEISTTYKNRLPTEFQAGNNYPDTSIPDWLQNYNTNVNDSNLDDGYGLNWDRHSTGTCNTCGNMIGEVNSILLGF